MGKVDSDLQADKLRYIRTGYIDNGHKSDRLLAIALEKLPAGQTLPARWRFTDSQDFVAKYGKVAWSRTASSHLFVLNGILVCRMWHDAANTLLVDMSAEMASILRACLFSVWEIPAGSERKTKPFTHRIILQDFQETSDLFTRIARLYGLDC